MYSNPCGPAYISDFGDDEFQNIIIQKLLGILANNGAKQKVIPKDETEKYITGGWEYVATLSNNKVIVKVPFMIS